MIQLYAGLEKYSCDMCGKLGVKPKYKVIHKDKSSLDICQCCYNKCINYPKFNEGIKNKDIKVITY